MRSSMQHLETKLAHCLLEGVLGFRVSRDLTSRLILGISRVTIWDIGITNLLTKSP